MKLNLKSDLKFRRFAIYVFFQIETLTCTTSTTRYYKLTIMTLEEFYNIFQNIKFKYI